MRYREDDGAAPRFFFLVGLALIMAYHAAGLALNSAAASIVVARPPDSTASLDVL
jgi:hypothetical protein